MTRRISRERRRAMFMEKAGQMFDDLESWYDEHLEASFGEIEAEARKQRRELMGEAMGVLVNGRDTGCKWKRRVVQSVGMRWNLKDIGGGSAWLEGDTKLERAYYVCPECTGETIFPLDRKLQLRADHWSAGAARVAVRQGLQAKSFDLAAEAYQDAVGGSMSGDSLRRVTEGWGRE